MPRQFKNMVEQLKHWVGLKTKFPEDLKPIFGDKITRLSIEVPKDLSEEDKKRSVAQVRGLWEKRVNMTAKREMALVETSLKQLYTVVWGQCSKGMKAQIRADGSYEKVDSSSDVVSLLKIILGICYSHDSNKELYRTFHDALRNFYSFKQNESLTVTEYYEEFLVRVDAVELYSGSDIWNREKMIKDAMSNDGKYDINMSPTDLLLTDETTSDYVDYAEVVRERFLATCFLRGSDQKHFGKLLAELDNNYARKQHQYPTTIKGAYDYLLAYTDPTPAKKSPHKNYKARNTAPTMVQSVPGLMEETQQEDVIFLQDEDTDLVPNTDGKVYLGVTYRKCGSRANKCPQVVRSGNQVQLFQSARTASTPILIPTKRT